MPKKSNNLGVKMFFRSSKPKEYIMKFYHINGDTSTSCFDKEIKDQIYKKIEEEGMTFAVPCKNGWINLLNVTTMICEEDE